MNDHLLADSGSSKTDWVWLNQGKVAARFQSAGLNPYFLSPDRISEEIRKAMPAGFDGSLPESVSFFGSGCSSPDRQAEVREALRAVFPYAEVAVDSDLLGAARALFGGRPGLAAILGTGSNACLYDGLQMVAGIRSLGYLFGDWGSGAVIGKDLVTCWLGGVMPQGLSSEFEAWHGFSFEQVLEGSYRNERPSKFLAAFVPFLSLHTDHPWVAERLRVAFDDFFSKMVFTLPAPTGYPFGAVGSVAFHFQDFLQESALKAGFSSFKVLASPIDGLVLNHLENMR